MRRISYLLLGSLLGLYICHGHSASGEIPTVDGWELLAEKYHAPLTTDALLRALRDPVSDVRSLAALMLAAGNQKGAVPGIAAALANETVPGARISLALAEARLGEDDGYAELAGMCQDSSWPAALRMSAAQALTGLGKQNCLGSAIAVLRSADDIQAVLQALSLLEQSRNVPSGGLEEIRDVTPPLLTSKIPAIRAGASDLLGRLGDSFSQQRLEDALSAEGDESVRKAIAPAIASIQARAARPASEQH